MCTAHASGARSLLVALAVLGAALVMAPAALAAGTVSVTVTGQGSASGDGINCTQSGGPDCSEFYADETAQDCDPARKPPCITFTFPPTVGFTAGADSNGYVYDGWTGCDSVSGRTCTLTVDGSTGITARFRDAQAPSVSAPTPSSGVQRGTITLAASASDNSGLIQRVEFRVRGALVGTDTSAPYSASFNTASVSDGAAAVTATAVDAANLSRTGTSNITIDNTAPTLAFTGGPNGQTFGPGTTQTWTFSAADPGSGVASVQCSVVSAGAPASFGPCNSGGSHSVSNRPDGSYAFTVRVTDNGGLVTTSPARTFSIDATPPETSIASGPADGSSSTDTTVVFGFTAGQAGSTFECRVYPAALTPPAFGSCTAAGGHTATGFSPGTYSFEVRATDPYGNTDASPAKRTFTVVAPSTDPGPGTGTDTGTGTGAGGAGTGTSGGTSTGGTSTGGTSTTTTTTTTITTTVVFDPRITSNFFYKASKTRFTQLVVTRLPKGAKVRVTCKGKGCAFKRKSVASKGAKLNVLKKLKKLRLRSGATLSLRITGPAGDVKVATWRIRKGKAPKTTYRCAAKGAKLGRCA